MANTTADKLALLEDTKADLKAALAEKGQTVGDVFSTYPAAVRAIETGGGSVTITFGTVDVEEAYVVYTDQEGNAQSLSKPSPGQSFTALKGSACCVIVSSKSREVVISSQDLPVSKIISQTPVLPPVRILVSLVTLSDSGSIALAPT